MYLLDTNICIYLIRKQSQALLKNIQSHSVTDIAISAITLAELRYGVEKSGFPKKNSDALDLFLLPIEILPFDTAASFTYGKIRADLERSGRLMGPLDMMIAGHALSLEAVLITNDEREFSRVKKLRIENWTK
ncbi:type II toxin-antitoxin system VapC family toxin [Bdellovibrionota bacterium FG-2]